MDKWRIRTTDAIIFWGSLYHWIFWNPSALVPDQPWYPRLYLSLDSSHPPKPQVTDYWSVSETQDCFPWSGAIDKHSWWAQSDNSPPRALASSQELPPLKQGFSSLSVIGNDWWQPFWDRNQNAIGGEGIDATCSHLLNSNCQSFRWVNFMCFSYLLCLYGAF